MAQSAITELAAGRRQRAATTRHHALGTKHKGDRSQNPGRKNIKGALTFWLPTTDYWLLRQCANNRF